MKGYLTQGGVFCETSECRFMCYNMIYSPACLLIYIYVLFWKLTLAPTCCLCLGDPSRGGRYDGQAEKYRTDGQLRAADGHWFKA